MRKECILPHISLMDPQHHGGRITQPRTLLTLSHGKFQQAFRTAHVSAGAMAMKKREFHNLRQGGRTVGQYVEDFSKLARYAPDEVATDAAK